MARRLEEVEELRRVRGTGKPAPTVGRLEEPRGLQEIRRPEEVEGLEKIRGPKEARAIGESNLATERLEEVGRIEEPAVVLLLS